MGALLLKTKNPSKSVTMLTPLNKMSYLLASTFSNHAWITRIIRFGLCRIVYMLSSKQKLDMTNTRNTFIPSIRLKKLFVINLTADYRDTCTVYIVASRVNT